MVNNGFDPLIALGQFQAESGLGTKGHATQHAELGQHPVLRVDQGARRGRIRTGQRVPLLRVSDLDPGRPGVHPADETLRGARFRHRREDGRALARGQGRDAANEPLRRQHPAGDAPASRLRRRSRCVSTTGGAKQPAAPAKPKAPPVIYVVKSGDTMSGIAKHELGSSARWPEIYRIAANRKLIGANPGLIRPGQAARHAEKVAATDYIPGGGGRAAAVASLAVARGGSPVSPSVVAAGSASSSSRSSPSSPSPASPSPGVTLGIRVDRLRFDVFVGLLRHIELVLDRFARRFLRLDIRLWLRADDAAARDTSG